MKAAQQSPLDSDRHCFQITSSTYATVTSPCFYACRWNLKNPLQKGRIILNWIQIPTVNNQKVHVLYYHPDTTKIFSNNLSWKIKYTVEILGEKIILYPFGSRYIDRKLQEKLQNDHWFCHEIRPHPYISVTFLVQLCNAILQLKCCSSRPTHLLRRIWQVTGMLFIPQLPGCCKLVHQNKLTKSNKFPAVTNYNKLFHLWNCKWKVIRTQFRSSYLCFPGSEVKRRFHWGKDGKIQTLESSCHLSLNNINAIKDPGPSFLYTSSAELCILQKKERKQMTK